MHGMVTPAPRFLYICTALLSVALACGVEAREQIIGVPAGERVDLTGGRNTITAYCLEKNVRGFHDESQPRPRVSGRVSIEFKESTGKPPIEVDTAEAVRTRLLAFYGAAHGASYTATITADHSIANVTFLQAAAL